MGAWNKILSDIQEVVDFAFAHPSCKLFYRGIEVHTIEFETAKKENQNEWLRIYITTVGPMANPPSWDQDRGFGVNCIARFDKWHMDEAYIREQLTHLEVRKVNIVKSF